MTADSQAQPDQDASGDLPDFAKVGARVLVLSHRATVRYIGNVVEQQGLWAGLEYDDPSRGKHDGTTGGHRYFTTKGGPTAASFVRLEKVDWGCSLVDALAARYSNQRGELGVQDPGDDELWVRTASNRRVHIQVVGVEQIQQLQRDTHRLASARLAGAGVSHVGDVSVLRPATASLVELDLTSNLVSDWDAFAPQLCEAVSTLQVLNLSDNALQLPTAGPPHEPEGSVLQGVLPGLRGLVLNNCGVTWQQVTVLQQWLPNLKELHMAGNQLTTLTCSAQGGSGVGSATGSDRMFQSLQVLSLENNQLRDWQQVVHQLGELPNLQTLNLSNNPLASPMLIPSQPPTFTRLHALYMASCTFTSWMDIDSLHQLPALQELRCTGNPVVQHAKGGGRYEVIGRVGSLTLLNGSAVSSRERQDAEIRYLQNIVSSGLSAAEVRKQHPRFQELVSRHGQVLATAAQKSCSNSISGALIQLKLTCVAAAPTAKMGSHEKKLPRSTQMKAIRLLCEQLFRVKVGVQQLFVKSPRDPVPQDITHEEDITSIAALGWQDGYELLVDQSQ